MPWYRKYQLFLFDFDGLLVDTESLHYQAYIIMCAQRGFDLNWSFQRYSKAAHLGANNLRNEIYAEFPRLKSSQPNWSILYEEKKQILLNIVKTVSVSLMPGVADFLSILKEENLKRCVVTNSPAHLVHSILGQNSILKSIPNWITREDYKEAKPNPECYQKAIEKFAEPSDSIVGFEDSPRGLQALLKTKAKPILICPPDSIYLDATLKESSRISYYPSFNSINCSF